MYLSRSLKSHDQMADYGAAISLSRDLSHTSDSDSSPRVPLSSSSIKHAAAASTGTGGPRNGNNNDIHDDDDDLRMQTPVHMIQRKPRGRPPGSKNKPKPPIIITKDSDSAMKTNILEISAGADIIETIITFARRNHVGVTVMSATGSVSNVTLRHPVPHAPSFSLHGPFNILDLFGSFVGGFAKTTKASSSSGSGSGSGNPGSSVYSCTYFGISLAGAQGQMFGGIVAGKVVAATPVVVVVTTFTNPLYHKLPCENDEGKVETKPNIGGGHKSSMTVYGAANPTPINCQMSPPDVMHWASPPSRPPY